MRLYFITGPDDKMDIIAKEIRVRPNDTAKRIEKKAVAIKERLNREWGYRCVIGVWLDRNVKSEYRNLRQVRRAIRKYRRRWDYFCPTGVDTNFITVLIDGKNVTVEENRWDYKRESRKWEIKNRFSYLLHPYDTLLYLRFKIRCALKLPVEV